MDINVTVDQESITNAVATKILKSGEFWKLLKFFIEERLLKDFDEKKDEIIEQVTKSLSSTISYRVDRSVDHAQSHLEYAITGFRNTALVKIQELEKEFDARLNNALVTAIRQSYGQKLGQLIARAVEKIALSLKDESE